MLSHCWPIIVVVNNYANKLSDIYVTNNRLIDGKVIYIGYYIIVWQMIDTWMIQEVHGVSDGTSSDTV